MLKNKILKCIIITIVISIVFIYFKCTKNINAMDLLNEKEIIFKNINIINDDSGEILLNKELTIEESKKIISFFDNIILKPCYTKEKIAFHELSYVYSLNGYNKNNDFYSITIFTDGYILIMESKKIPLKILKKIIL